MTALAVLFRPLRVTSGHPLLRSDGSGRERRGYLDRLRSIALTQRLTALELVSTKDELSYVLACCSISYMMRELPCFLIKPRPYSLEAIRWQIACFTAWEPHICESPQCIVEPSKSGSGTLLKKWSH